jgi:hypothetical protein
VEHPRGVDPRSARREGRRLRGSTTSTW